MTPEAEALAEEISAIIEAKMKVAWQEAEPAANAISEEFARRLRPRVDDAVIGSQSPSYEALLIIAQSVAGALVRAGVTDCDDPGEAIDVIREGYEKRISEQKSSRIALLAPVERDVEADYETDDVYSIGHCDGWNQCRRAVIERALSALTAALEGESND